MLSEKSKKNLILDNQHRKLFVKLISQKYINVKIQFWDLFTIVLISYKR